MPRSRCRGKIRCPRLPQPSRLRTKGFPLPTTFRVGLAYDVLAGANNRLTVLADFNQPNNNSAGFAVGTEWRSNRIGGTGFGVALRGSYSYTGANDLEPVTLETGLNDEENFTGGVRGRVELRDGEGVQAGGRLRVQVHGRARPDELLQLHAGMVSGSFMRAAATPRPGSQE